MLRNFLTIFILAGTFSAFGQFCGTKEVASLNFDEEAFQAYLQSPRATLRSDQDNRRRIGITIHVVEAIAGASNIDITKLYEEVDAINRFFTPSGIEFFLCGAPRILAGKGTYTYSSADRELNTGRNHVPNTINIYYVDEIGDVQLSALACGISTFPWDGEASTRFIIMQKGCSTNGSVLAHEIGHFFGLWHTHTVINGVEYVDGSNCEIAGDLLCDTPADPNLGNVGLNGCSYEANFIDSRGDKYSPDPSNIMSYAPPRCAIRFSKDQDARMNFFIEATDLSELIDNCDFYPDFAMQTEQTFNEPMTAGQVLNITYLFSNEGISEEKEVELTVSLIAEDGTIRFIIHKETLVIQPGQSSFEKTIAIEIPLEYSSGKYEMTVALDPDSKIQERDKRNNFHEFDITIDNSSIVENLIFPNPAKDKVRLFLKDNVKTGKFELTITDYLGRTYQKEEFFKGSDELLFQTDVSNLQAGLYILNLNFLRNDKQESFLLYKE